ncbi:BMP family ABC transporter substrate-binding protein [Nitrososphaera viennensis]|uniref:Carbamate kinase n=2 Tax=Nitrososphaera viennensis TaxID=1034015 RepID=A0A060HGY7_9ARCH|nr:BMP family ABC transporter substrate-binding protein [Nitrososphaera viennensis]AIC15849.1 putative carbamate kinase with BmpA-like periplasmic binding domain [Nitrososphaera viennensis EN76]UVS67838.1 BMP family ABC transporter substrate-binding protein [Nitrososphaera viennensis]
MQQIQTVVIALGGNALLKRDDKGTFAEQFANVQAAAKGIADLLQKGYRVVLTHGNGPQVGATVLRHEAAKNTVPPFPLYACNAETQGMIGYMVVQGLQNELDARGIKKSVVSLVTRVVVNQADPAFKNPTKPVGPYFERHQYPNLLNIFEGYKQGARYVNPDIRVLAAYLGDWDSPLKGREVAMVQIGSGADVLLHTADTSGHGVIEAAKEKGIYAFGAVADQNRLAPDTVLTSFVLDIDKAFDQAVQMVLQDKFEGKVFKPGIEAEKGGPGDGIVYLAPFHSLDGKVSVKVKKKLEELTRRIISKEITVPEKYEATTDTIAGQVPSAPARKQLKIALVTDALFSDGGWGATAYSAGKLLESKYGYKLAYAENIAIPDIEATLRQYANDGYDLIIAHGFQWGDPAVKVGKDYPNTKFVVFTGLVSSQNVASIFPMQQEGTFLLGALAAMMSKTGIIGYVGGDQIDRFIADDVKFTFKYQGDSRYRRVVPSPKPVAILEHQAIRLLADAGFVVVACGGGGIPVIEVAGGWSGVDAVIDKDLAGEKMARQIGADKFVILTDVDGLYMDYKKPTQRLVKEVRVGQPGAVNISQLEEGSMGPKVGACLEFVRNGGREAVIASLDRLVDAVEGLSGTHFFP